jgi:hypothetical protein
MKPITINKHDDIAANNAKGSIIIYITNINYDFYLCYHSFYYNYNFDYNYNYDYYYYYY